MIDGRECKRIKAIYAKRISAARKLQDNEKFLTGFPTAQFFEAWWRQKLDKQDRQCAYCQTPISLITTLIDADLLRTRKTRGNGKRGKCLELERKDSFGCYEPDNCVLVCMFCNNDKSNIYDHHEYEVFFGPNRKKHFEWLATKLVSP